MNLHIVNLVVKCLVAFTISDQSFKNPKQMQLLIAIEKM
jgi:hypothetical protein